MGSSERLVLIGRFSNFFVPFPKIVFVHGIPDPLHKEAVAERARSGKEVEDMTYYRILEPI